MFTGIVEEIGVVKEILKNSKSLSLKISAKLILEDIKIGDSICTNGVCLTVTDFSNNDFTVDAIESTFNKTNLSRLEIGDKLNLERALNLKTRLGGHIVQGHVDSIGEIKKIRKEDLSKVYKISTTKETMDLIVNQGSIAVNGISLTISNLFNDGFEISIIPETTKQTTISNLKVGDIVNLETDIIGKYIKSFIMQKNTNNVKKDITLDFLLENGF